MTTKTRYFVIASLLVLGVGLGSGLVAYYVGFPAGAATRAGGPEELQYIPHDATVVAYADVQDVMASELRQRIAASPADARKPGSSEFENQTGINIETDIDHVVACLKPDPAGGNAPGQGLVLARGTFNEVKIESLMREHGAQVEQYKTSGSSSWRTGEGATATGATPAQASPCRSSSRGSWRSARTSWFVPPSTSTRAATTRRPACRA